HSEATHLRILQKKLAEEITVMVHSRKEYDDAVEASMILFGNATSEALKNLDEKTFLSVFEGLPIFNVEKSLIENGIDISEILCVQTNVFSSKGELRRTIQGNGLSINKEKFNQENGIINSDFLINDKYILVQKGKKNYFVIIAS
ncbi:MAG: tyrosine--tRNA ligase, partial [Bacteroidales bacterium]|nr:tyrosine--tRNA ligase [Bacteroidales bacterium]